MPIPTLKVKAESVRKRAESSFDKRVATAAKAKLARIDGVSKALVGKVGTALEQHFAKQDAAGLTPYPDYDRGGYGVRIAIETEKLGKQGDNLVAATQHGDELQAIVDEVTSALKDAGYEAQIYSYDPFTLFVRDPMFGVDE